MAAPVFPSDPHVARRRARREQVRRRVRRRRRVAAAVVVLVAGAGLWVAGAGSLGGEASDETRARSDEPQAEPRKPAELPGGGRSIFPEHRVVAFYGAPQDDELGELGIGPVSKVAGRLRKQARPYERKRRPVLPAFELIATVAAAAPGPERRYSYRQEAKVIRRYLRAARKAKALLLLDVQPGRSDFMDEARHLERFLREPDVGLALDPEWSMGPGEIPGKVIGSTTAAKINEVSAYLQQLARKHHLPEKLLVVHRFTEDMIGNDAELADRREVELVINVDGFGTAELKADKYRDFTADRKRGARNGFKLFYREDTGLMTPKQVLALRPAPDLVIYE
ncbi:MAG: hypothetical protein ACR2NA_09330 [Solirubrobacterales bacterium]